MPEKVCAIGIDLGGTKIETALVSQEGVIIKRIRMATDVKGGFGAIQNQVVSAINDLRQMATDQLVGIGIGIAGQVEAHTGIVRFAPNLQWHDVPFQANLQKTVELPIIVTNDVRAATWGEWIYGSGKGCQDFVCIFVGTGIGGGVVSGGHMLAGGANTFAEVGHMVIDVNGPVCSCGRQGCFEAVAGGWATARTAQEEAKRNAPAAQQLLQLAEGQVEKITTKLVAKAAQAKDPLAIQILETVKDALIVGCSNIVNLYSPSRLILGGGLIEGMPELLAAIEQGVRRTALTAATASLEIMPAKLRGDAGVIGGAAYALQNFALEATH
jgi:glucokinase